MSQINEVIAEIGAGIGKMRDKIEALDSRLLDVEQKRVVVPGFGGTGNAQTAAKLLTSSPEIQAFAARKLTSAGASIPLKAFAATTSDNATNPSYRIPGVAARPTQRIYLRELLPIMPVESASFEFTRETSSLDDTKAAAQWDGSDSPGFSEGAIKKESNFGFQAIVMPVSTVAHFTKVSRQVMNDNARLQQFIGERMRSGVELRCEQDIINGTGASGQMSGLLKAGNFTAFTPATGDDRVDSLRRAKLALESADYNCGMFIMNPYDVAQIELQRDDEERFLIANPLEGAMPQIWGTPIYWSTKISVGQFIALDLAAVMVGVREEVDLRFSEDDEDNFQRNLVSVRAEMRAGLGVLQPGGVRAGALLQG